MQSTINSKLQDLESWFKDYDSVLIAFSGGVDSTLLAKAAFNSIGKKAVAVTADSPSIPRSELTNAKSLAQLIGIEHLVINTNEMENPDYVKNPSNRCYYCKSELFSTLSTLSKEKNIDYKNICLYLFLLQQFHSPFLMQAPMTLLVAL